MSRSLLLLRLLLLWSLLLLKSRGNYTRWWNCERIVHILLWRTMLSSLVLKLVLSVLFPIVRLGMIQNFCRRKLLYYLRRMIIKVLTDAMLALCLIMMMQYRGCCNHFGVSNAVITIRTLFLYLTTFIFIVFIIVIIILICT